MKTLVVFDWNGTLISDTKLIVRATNYVLKKLKIKETELFNYTKFLYYKIQHTKHIEEVKQKLMNRLPF